jgi:hypothetical protein
MVLPRRHTFVAARTSWSVKKSPRSICQSRIEK